MDNSIQYITNDRGDPISVVLDINTYTRLTSPADENLLLSLGVDELQALAYCKLAIAEQNRIDELIERNIESLLSENEIAELDELLARADQLMILKTRARYTLKYLSERTNAA
jgi:hypothetical protein